VARINIKRHPNANGDPEKLVIVNRDITEPQASGGGSAAVGSGISVGGGRTLPMEFYRASTSGRFLQVNPALQKTLGYELREELLGRDLATEIFRYPGEYQRLSEPSLPAWKSQDVELEWKAPGRRADYRAVFGTPASMMKTAPRRTSRCLPRT